MDNTNIFQFLAIFSQNFDYFTPKIAIFGLIQLGIIATIVSEIMNHQYVKFYVFIKKFTIDVIFHWLYNVISCAGSWPSPILSL